jgi:hypothetical protein
MLTPYVIGLAFANCASTVYLAAVIATARPMGQEGFEEIPTWSHPAAGSRPFLCNRWSHEQE